MQDMILSEVLDSSSGVRWSDIAGLATAKQASRACKQWHLDRLYPVL